jgi:hypothetical protein
MQTAKAFSRRPLRLRQSIVLHRSHCSRRGATDVAMVPIVVCESSKQAKSSITTIRKVARVDETAVVNQLDIEELFSSPAVENFAVVGSNLVEPEAGDLTVYHLVFGQSAVEQVTAVSNAAPAENKFIERMNEWSASR